MAEAVTVEGEKRLAATLAVAGARLADMSTAGDAAARLVLSRARVQAPRVSGRLAASMHSEARAGEAVVGSSLVYAPVIHNGWPAHNIAADPFLVPAASATEPVWRTYYVGELRQIFNRVKGA